MGQDARPVTPGLLLREIQVAQDREQRRVDRNAAPRLVLQGGEELVLIRRRGLEQPEQRLAELDRIGRSCDDVLSIDGTFQDVWTGSL
jgi:hypothetical protein